MLRTLSLLSAALLTVTVSQTVVAQDINNEVPSSSSETKSQPPASSSISSDENSQFQTAF